jgi:hypothetical protein
VKFIGDRCFQICAALQTVSFDLDSKLSAIGIEVFSHCVALKSISLPSTLQVIGEGCFWYCLKLHAVNFAPDSKLVRIEKSAFNQCSALQSIILPASVEFVGENCFADCRSLSTLTFSSPSHLRELLDLPPLWKDLQEIPDSVEVLGFPEYPNAAGTPMSQPCESILNFGRESRLAKIARSNGWRWSFLRASSRSLIAVRSNLEFQESA